MTSTTDTTGHPDVAELSDLTEGLLAPSRSAELRRHLDDCELCADTHASLEEIRSLLGTFPEPVAMPDDVARRIDAALAAEAAETEAPETAKASAAPEVSDVSRETSIADRCEASVPDRPSGRARATTGPGRKDKSKGTGKGANDRPRTRRRTAAVLGVFTAAALGLGSVLLTSHMGDGDGGSTNTAADTFFKGSLSGEVSALLPRHRTSRPSVTPKGEVGIQGNVESPQVLQAVNVPACVQQGTARTEAAIAMKEGVYEGKDVLLVVFPHTADTRQVDAYIVDTACEDHPSAQADVLLKGTYARP